MTPNAVSRKAVCRLTDRIGQRFLIYGIVLEANRGKRVAPNTSAIQCKDPRLTMKAQRRPMAEYYGSSCGLSTGCSKPRNVAFGSLVRRPFERGVGTTGRIDGSKRSKDSHGLESFVPLGGSVDFPVTGRTDFRQKRDSIRASKERFSPSCS